MAADYSGPKEVNDAAFAAANQILGRTTDLFGLKPKIMIVLGSGCGDVANKIEPRGEIPYEEILGMPVSTVAGHKGALLVGTYNGKPVLAFQGRKHYYEGASPQQASFPVYLGKHLGATVVIMTTATGIVPYAGTMADQPIRYPANVGDLVAVQTYDRNFLPSSLRGPTSKDVGERFNPTINAPNIYLTLLAQAIAASQGWRLQKGVYVPQEGPDYETPAEISFLSALSYALRRPVLAGMSMTPELQAANMLKLDSLVIAVVTNHCFDMAAREQIERELADGLGKILDSSGKTATHTLAEANAMLEPIKQRNQPSHAEVTEVAGRSNVTERLEKLLGGVVNAIKFK